MKKKWVSSYYNIMRSLTKMLFLYYKHVKKKLPLWRIVWRGKGSWWPPQAPRSATSPPATYPRSFNSLQYNTDLFSTWPISPVYVYLNPGPLFCFDTFIILSQYVESLAINKSKCPKIYLYSNMICFIQREQLYELLVYDA